MSPRAQRVLFGALVILGLVIAGIGVALIKHQSSDSSAHHPAAGHAERAVAIGRAADRGGVRVTVLAVEDPASDVGVAAPADDRWVSVEARTCVASGHPGLQTGWYQFSTTDAAGNRFPGIVWPQGAPAGISQLPSIYPQFQLVAPGSCVSGWLLVPVPHQVRLSGLVHTGAGGVETGMWSLAG